MNNLTPKQEGFCISYIETGNASEAYRLNYSASKMSQAALKIEACKLLKHPHILKNIWASIFLGLAYVTF